MIPVGPVNTFLLEGSDGCTLIDSGFPGSAAKILDAVHGLGKQDKDIRHIVLTHAHPDHIGSFAALKKATGAVTRNRVSYGILVPKCFLKKFLAHDDA